MQARPWTLVTVAVASVAIACSGAKPLQPSERHSSAPGLEIRTAKVWSGVERYCRLAAARTAIAIPCPTIAPAAAHPRSQWVMCRSVDEQLEGKGCSRQAFILEEHFSGPPTYAGLPGPHGPLPFGHLAIWAARGDTAGDLPCASPRLLRTGRIGSVTGHWYVCRTGGLNAGHVAFVWNIGRVGYGVSLHRNSQVNRRLLERIVAQLSIIRGT